MPQLVDSVGVDYAGMKFAHGFRLRATNVVNHKKMRYLLIPITFVIWCALTFYGLLLCLVGMSYVFSLSWIWLYFGYLFLVGIVPAILIGIPLLFRVVISKFYGINWFTCLVHSSAGLLGAVGFFIYYVSNPPVVVIGEDEVRMFYGMWMLAPFKSIVIAFPFLGIFASIIWAFIVSPVYWKLTGLDLTGDESESPPG